MKFEQLRGSSRTLRDAPWDTEETIRSELFSSERLEQHAESLAAAQPVTDRPAKVRSLSLRLKENEAILVDAHRAIASTVAGGGAITPSAEWLLDNFHIVEEQVREIRDDLPPQFYRQLPKLSEGPFIGYPRIFGIAWAFVAHTDSRFEPELLCRFLRSYQRVQPLTIGELWAIAITLRIVLVENLRRAARRIVMSRDGRLEADALADRLLASITPHGEEVLRLLERYDRADVSAAFAVQLVHRLRDQDPRVTRVLSWLEDKLAQQQTTIDRVVHEEHQSQGGTNVTVRNIITSMRLISDVDWADLFEDVSLVDAALRTGSAFAEMDFPTRNLYRNAIEELARGSPLTELEVVQAVLRGLPDEAAAKSEAEGDPGYCLIGEGRRAFEKQIGFRVPVRYWPRRFNATLGMRGLVAVSILLAVTILSLPLSASSDAAIDLWRAILLGALGLLPALDAAVALINPAITREVSATPLPALALSDGIPAELRTMVAVPTLLTDLRAVEEQIDRLEVHFLASSEGDLHYALLTDWMDAPTETVEGDQALFDTAAAGIARLNALYGPAPGGPRFLLLHRRRVWNEGQRRWLGWERKRGKLHELNRLLRGDTETTFFAPDGRRPTLPEGVRYVITLDADTRMPRETPRRLVGKMAHALNRPRFDPKRQRVVSGYGVLQPRVTPSLPVGRQGSVFQRVFSSASGIDPYAFAVSDVYQDLFGEGSYTGKGIYDVDSFELSLAGRVPDNSVLSHDLFEGTFARAGFVSDVELIEDFPSRYDAAAARQHRWVRGDWQLLPWLLGRPPSPALGRYAATLPRIGRWKMIDNLRRSVTAPAGVAMLLVAWSLPFDGAVIWTAFVMATIALPMLLPVAAGLTPRQRGVSLRSHVRAVGSDLSLAFSRIALLITFLAHQAWLMTDAIARTLFRLFVSHRHMLDWVTAAQAAKSDAERRLPGFYRRMSGALLLAIAGGLVVFVSDGDSWPLALPFIVLWIASPAIARRVSNPPPAAGSRPLAADDVALLRHLARRTWRYFETFVTEEHHALPPDNFQEFPKPAVAGRTSPTNLGLYLLGVVAARDFGWIGLVEALDRLEATLSTMRGLSRFRGHFLNWYDTRDLRPLEPRYVSSVDSGNLAGHLIALANSCKEWTRLQTTNSCIFNGVADTLSIARSTLNELPNDRRVLTTTRQQLEGAFETVAEALDSATRGEGDIRNRLQSVACQVATMVDVVHTHVSERGDETAAELRFWVEAVERAIASHVGDLESIADDERALHSRLAVVEESARDMANAMEFGFLLDPARKLLSIGYRVADGELDPSCYDLLASEARLASFVAIAKGDIPARHWFRLGRTVTPVEGGAALISWSGSMFEYLMPSLIMRAPTGSLLEHTSQCVVRRQISFGKELGVPWGISESAYNVRDLEFTYQYSTFGVPGLGLKRGLSESIVVAPYATALAAMVDPAAAADNFRRLAKVGALGNFGYYEALDYTPARIPEGSDVAIVRAFMAHHQGMTLVALADALLQGQMRERFHAEAMVQATELLLQERRPRDVVVAHPRAEEVKTAASVRDFNLAAPRRIRSVHTWAPETQLLSNGRYTVMLTAAGSGYSRWKDLAITRWREDVTRDDWGAYTFLRDTESGEVWSAGYQPSGIEPDHYDVTFTEDRATIVRRDGDLTTTLEVVVTTEDDAEVRRVSIANAGTRTREIEITSYCELVLAPPAADAAHPAFSKLFVETEYLSKLGVILATRRRRSPDEPAVWAAHFAVAEGEVIGKSEIETDRAQFLGRGRDVRRPIAVRDGLPLSATRGTVLDAVFALRRRVRVAPATNVRVAFWTVVATSRVDVIDLADKHHDAAAFDRAATLAWTQAQVQLNHLGINSDEASLFQRLAGRLLYADPSLRASPDAIRRGAAAPPALWTQGISGDLPVVLARIDIADDLTLVRQLLRAHEYWRMKGLEVDLVLLNERGASYVQDLQISLESLVRTSRARSPVERPPPHGGVHVLRADLISTETRGVLLYMARVVLSGRHGTVAEQLDRHTAVTAGTTATAVRPATPRALLEGEPVPSGASAGLEFFNGLGGFADNGREYVTELPVGRSIPAPWINVIANPAFGFSVAVEGSGYTWALSSRENQLTPWSNDPVADSSGEAIYIGDEDTGELWGPTASPIRDPNAHYVARHGHGYSVFEHTSRGIALELLQLVPLDRPVKISRLKLHNLSERPRKLTVTAFAEWVLGPNRGASQLSIVTEVDPSTGALVARNPWNATFGSRVAFMDLRGQQARWTADRREFLGKYGTLDNPAALAADSSPLSGRVGAGLDACAALSTSIELGAGEVREVVVLLGQTATLDEMHALLTEYRGADIDAVKLNVVAFWESVLGTIRVKTPDRAMDILLNEWALYQTLVCRMWARAGFYQASGAYGFRDQLQDGMALVYTRPELTREHLLRAASRQFVEGDVQHWWLPASGHGVRTRISDDRVWLAYTTSHYVAVTGDTAVLDERVPFLEGPALQHGAHDAYFEPQVSEETGSLFEHCARALDQSLAVGTHGLPLIGTGDWNDGMNRVGEHGDGESVWLGWILCATLEAFAPLAKARREHTRARKWTSFRSKLMEALERDGWDGEWYRRGYFDDGTPLGSAVSDECRIDSIAQSWAVISGAGDEARASTAMNALDRELVQRGADLALLFTPPFDRGAVDPGYIKGYPPGIRENGGQYTHAAAWAVIACAMLGRGDKAMELFGFLNPITRTSTRARVQRYKVEPYAVAADVYSESPHAGRGGWTWYTGSAGWLYRAGIESILGLQIRGNSLRLSPCIPPDWPGFGIDLESRSARYEIRVDNPHQTGGGVSRMTLDGNDVQGDSIELVDDGLLHRLHVVLGA